MEIKKATTYREQAEKIEQRGCCIENLDDAVRCLETINYYRLSAYFYPSEKKMVPILQEPVFLELCRYMNLTDN